MPRGASRPTRSPGRRNARTAHLTRNISDRTKVALRLGVKALGGTVPTTGKANDGPASVGKPETVGLRRSLTLPYAVLYGMGVTIGAGIYVLIGAAAARAGMQAPLEFVAAAMLMTLTALSFAELSSRMAVAAGEAAYVREAFGTDRWSAAVGFPVIVIAAVAAAAISVGSAGYILVSLLCPNPSSSPPWCSVWAPSPPGASAVRCLRRRNDLDRGWRARRAGCRRRLLWACGAYPPARNGAA